MDIAKLSPRKAADGGAVLHLKDPATGDPLYDENGDPITVEVLGADSDVVKEKRREIERRRAKGEDIDEAESGADFLAAITVGWQGIGLHGSKPLKFSYANARKLYLDPDAEWVAGQVGPFSRDRRNYVKNRPSD